MRNTQLIVATLTLFTTLISASFNTPPSQCTSVCSSLASISDACERTFNSDDSTSYYHCVCYGQNANVVVPLCEGCVYAYEKRTDPNDGESEWSDTDANKILRACNLTRVDYNLDVPSATVSMQAALATTGGSTVARTASVTATGAAAATNAAAVVGIAGGSGWEGKLSYVAGVVLLGFAALL